MITFIHAVKRNPSIEEVSIQTINTDRTQTPHFKHLLDSSRLYKELLRFSLSSLLCSAIDIGLFSIIFKQLSVNTISPSLLVATGIARLISSTINYKLNKTLVFESKKSNFAQASKYYMLCLVQMIFSWLILQMLSSLNIGPIIILKIFADIFLFFFSFVFQRVFIFRRPI